MWPLGLLNTHESLRYHRKTNAVFFGFFCRHLAVLSLKRINLGSGRNDVEVLSETL